MPASLESLRMLVVDCQSTGANPNRGHLLEVAWAAASATTGIDASQVCSSLVSLPQGASIPRRISTITGITVEQLSEARPANQIWTELVAAAESVEDGWTIAHFVQFEQPFLVDLHERFGRGRFPLRLLCTREIARRIMLQLPRYGLRALASNLGHPLPETRRARDHVAATAFVWQHLCGLLAKRGVLDLAQLLQMLAEPLPRRSANERRFPLAEEQRRSLPIGPGVYRFIDPSDRVLYVGKAAHLRQRVGSYYQPRDYRLSTTGEMLTQASDVQVTETATRLEAALLEVDEIKRYDPPYNIALRSRQDRHQDYRATLAALAETLKSPTALFDDEDRVRLLGLAYPEPPLIDIVTAGIDLFKEVFSIGNEATPSTLKALGAILWWPLEQVASDAPTTSAEPLDPDPQKRMDEFTWTPQQIARTLIRSMRIAAQMLRREVWLSFMCECAIKWNRRDSDPPPRMLQIAGGRVQISTDMTPEELIPTPVHCKKSLGDRRSLLDPSTTDRLRVLTTEIRRLVADGRFVELSLGPRCRLSTDRVRDLLEWI